MVAPSTLRIELGRLFWANARHAVESINLHGGNISYTEGPGIIERDFSFHGSPRSIAILKRHFDRIIATNEALDAESDSMPAPKFASNLLGLFKR